MRYTSVLDELHWCFAVIGQFELVSKFEDEELFGVGVPVEVLLECSRHVSIGLDD